MDTQDNFTGASSREPTGPADFSIRNFLREREAVLVHFSTPQTSRPELIFPHDLRTAMGLAGEALCFSTVQAGDVGPHQRADMNPEDANAGGSIGILVDIDGNDCVTAVGPGDGGAYTDPTTGQLVSAGLPPTPENCARSIDNRVTANEWSVKNYRVVGIFAFLPVLVRQAFAEDIVVEDRIDHDSAFAHFPDLRVFSVHKGRFMEYDRQHWREVAYADILAPAVRPDDGVVIGGNVPPGRDQTEA